MFDDWSPGKKDALYIGGGVVVAGILAYLFWPASTTAANAALPASSGTVAAQQVLTDVYGPVTTLATNTSYVFAGQLANGQSKSALIASLQAQGWVSSTDPTQPPTLFYYPGTAANNYTDADSLTSWPADLPYPQGNFQNAYYAAAGTYAGTAGAASPTAMSVPTGVVAMQYVAVQPVTSTPVTPQTYNTQSIWFASGGGLFYANYSLCGSPQKVVAVGTSQQEVVTKAQSAINASCGTPSTTGTSGFPVGVGMQQQQNPNVRIQCPPGMVWAPPSIPYPGSPVAPGACVPAGPGPCPPGYANVNGVCQPQVSRTNSPYYKPASFNSFPIRRVG
jgi:hypothetical protein